MGKQVVYSKVMNMSSSPFVNLSVFLEVEKDFMYLAPYMIGIILKG